MTDHDRLDGPPCPKCGEPTGFGYGLAGGGMGAYAYCEAEGCDYFEKWQDPEYPEAEGVKCTCHPDDNPPVPCAQRRALSECVLLNEIIARLDQ